MQQSIEIIIISFLCHELNIYILFIECQNYEAKTTLI